MSWTHIEDSTPKAKKEYQCFLCGEVIKIGERHVRRFGYYDGDSLSSRMHVECEEESREWDQQDWESISFGCMKRPVRKMGV
jgi:hypothetical protein